MLPASLRACGSAIRTILFLKMVLPKGWSYQSNVGKPLETSIEVFIQKTVQKAEKKNTSTATKHRWEKHGKNMCSSSAGFFATVKHLYRVSTCSTWLTESSSVNGAFSLNNPDNFQYSKTSPHQISPKATVFLESPHGPSKIQIRFAHQYAAKTVRPALKKQIFMTSQKGAAIGRHRLPLYSTINICRLYTGCATNGSPNTSRKAAELRDKSKTSARLGLGRNRPNKESIIRILI